MKNTCTLIAITAACFVLATAGTDELHAQFEIAWYTIDGGGGFSSAGSFELEGTIGQHDAGPTMIGGAFSLTGGFWTGSTDEVLLGDLNGDGVVNLLDVAPFVDAVSNGDYVPEADINGDGVVNLLDVEPFVALLSGA